MDAEPKKLALRAINYGLYVLTAADGDESAAAGVNWLSQASFDPPLVVAGVKADSGTAAIIERTGAFAVNVLADDQLDIGKAFFRSTTVEGDTINGYRFERGPRPAPPCSSTCPTGSSAGSPTPSPGATTPCSSPRWSTPAYVTRRRAAAPPHHRDELRRLTAAGRLSAGQRAQVGGPIGRQLACNNQRETKQ